VALKIINSKMPMMLDMRRRLKTILLSKVQSIVAV
jgi:hypothetical protein